MSIENFVKSWTIRQSTTTLIAVGDKLNIDRVGNSPKVKFRCDSSDPGITALWDKVNNCKWSENGGAAGQLEGAISDQSDSDYSLEITYTENTENGPNQIDVNIVAVPVSGGVTSAAAGSGGAGGAGGDDG